MISEVAQTRLENIFDEFRRWWTPQELDDAYLSLIDDMRAENLIDVVRLREGPFRPFKDLVEEAYPLLKLGKWFQKEKPKSLVELRPRFDPRGRPDAILRIDGIEEPLEITQGVLPEAARNDRFVRELISNRRFASPSAAYDRDKSTGEIIEVEPATGGLVSEEELRVVRAAITASERKLKKASATPYEPGTSLLIWLDEYDPSGISDENRQMLRVALKPATTQFERIYALGSATFPIVVDA